MPRLTQVDLTAGGLAAAASALGYASGTGGLLLLFGVLTAVAGLVRARTALTIALVPLPLLLIVIGRSRASFVAGAICLAVAAGAWLWESTRSGPVGLGDLPEEVVAARIVLAATLLIAVGALLRFAQTYSL